MYQSETLEKRTVGFDKYAVIFVGGVTLSGLYLTSLVNYLLFHSLAEIFSIVIGCSIFILAWNSQRFLDNDYLLFIGIASLFVAGLDLIHALAYKGMGVFEEYDANLPTQLWIAARYVQSISLLTAPLLLGRKLKIKTAFLGYTVIASLLLGSIFDWNVFPECYIEGVGLTAFKKNSEYFISLILLVALVLLLRKRKEFDKGVLRLLTWSIAATIGAELAFTFYVGVYDFLNLVGHFLKIIAFYLVYSALIETGIRKPYTLLFRNLKQAEVRFRRLFEEAPVMYVTTRAHAGVPIVADCNQLFLDTLGYRRAEVVGQLLADFYAPDSRTKLFEDGCRQALDGGREDQECQLVTRDRQIVETLLRASPEFDADGTVLGTRAAYVNITTRKRAEKELEEYRQHLEGLVTKRTVELTTANEQLCQEIVERKRAEETLHRLNRELRAISNCNQILMRAENEQSLLKDICHIICDEAGYRMAWVGYAEDDEAKTIRPVTWAGVENGYLANAYITWADTEQGRGPSGIAIRSGESACIQDFTIDPQAAPWCDSALQRGYRSSIALPLKDENDKTFGALNIYSEEPNAFTLDEIRLLEELSDDLAFGITTLRTRAERKQAEEMLRGSEEKYRSLIQKVQTAIVLHDGQGRVLTGNPLAQHLLGLSEDHLLGKTLNDLTWRFLREDGSPMPISEYPVSLVLSSRQPLREYVVGIDHPDKLIWALINAEPEFANTGEIARVIVSFIDITEKKRAEEALRQSEEKYRTLFEESFDGLFITSPGGKILDMNKKGILMFGYDTKEEILSLDLARDVYVYPPDREQILAMVNAQGTAEYEVVVKKKNGDKMVTYCALTAVKNEIGTIVTYRGIIRDITEKKRREETLRKLSRAVEQSPISIVITDTTGAIEYVNPRFTELTGYTLEEALGQNPRILNSGTTSPEKYELLWKTITSGRTWQGEFCNRKKNGELYWEWASISPVVDQTGVITNFVATKENITERKKAEQQLEQYREHLEELVAKRTIELQTVNEQLQVLSRVKDEFVSNVSHELRTPITNLKLREHLLESHPTQLAKHLPVLTRETDRLARIIENLLQLSRLDQKRVTFSLAPVDLNGLIGQYILDRMLMAEDRNLTLTFHGEPDLPKAMADANLIEQALSVLLTNALNYTPAHGQVMVQTHTDPLADRQWIGFSVIDTGLGISPDEQTKLFTRFFRGQTGRKSGVPGTGLGLAIAKEIVERHGGKIEVKSDGIPGSGTTFTVWIPALNTI